MATRSIEAIIPPPPPHMVGDGFRVHSFFPGHVIDKRRMSPFFLLDYGSKIEFSPSPVPRGVDVHPHAGFETVTLSYHGKVAHHDSAGNSGIIGEGDVQWMTAGSGLLHKEYHEKEFSERGGLFQMVQLWVNLPAQYKKVAPKYQEITNKNMGKYELDDGSVIEVIAGQYNNVKGPAFTFTPIHVYNARMNQAAKASFHFPASYNAAFLIVEGSAMVNGTKVPTDNLVLLGNDGEDIQLEAVEESVILVLAGEPINEPIAAYGPFLMNTWEEVDAAIDDVSKGRFGFLE